MNLLALPLLLTALAAQGTQDAATKDLAPSAPAAPPRFVRLVEEGSEVQLQLAERHFTREAAEGEEGSPRVILVAAMHIGEPAYYEALQARLNGLDLVLFEGVGEAPLAVDQAAGAGSPSAWAIAATRRRMRVAATLLARHRAEHGTYPELLNAILPAADATPHGYDTVIDAWGRPLRYEVHPPAEAGAEPTFTLGSLGADGLEGGVKAARDLWFREQRPVEEYETEGRKGIQQDMAAALGLVFQLDAMSDLSPKWRNADATLTQVQQWLEADGAPLQLDSLAGDSMLSSVMGRALRLIGFSETMSGLVRMIGIEVLARAEVLLQDPPEGLDATMATLLGRRNAIVLEALTEATRPRKGGEGRTVGVLYGAAHHAAFQEALLGWGYRQEAETWRTAARVDLDDLGLPRAQVDWTRRMIAKQLDDLTR
jgi:hypothetical protein